MSELYEDAKRAVNGDLNEAIDTNSEDKLVKKVRSDWEKIAKEKLDIENIKGTLYAYGSELATLRLLKLYRTSKKVDASFSKNLKKFYFRLES